MAGLALSVAGFGALVTAFRRGAAWSRTEVSRLRNIVQLGFVCMFLGLVPVPVYYAVGGDQLLTIRLASLVIAFAETWELMLILRQRRHWENQSWVGPLVGIVSLEVAFNLLNAVLGALPLLMVGLLLWLAHPVYLFIRVVHDFQPPVAGD